MAVEDKDLDCIEATVRVLRTTLAKLREERDRYEKRAHAASIEGAVLREALRRFLPEVIVEDRTSLSPPERAALDALESHGPARDHLKEHEALKKQLDEEREARLRAEGVLKSCVFEGLSSGGDLIPSEHLKRDLKRAQALLGKRQRVEAPDDARLALERLVFDLVGHPPPGATSEELAGSVRALAMRYRDDVGEERKRAVKLVSHLMGLIHDAETEICHESEVEEAVKFLKDSGKLLV